MDFMVKEECLLLEFLKNKINILSKNNIKSLLVNNHVYVNKRIVNNYNYVLSINDEVRVCNNYVKTKFGLDIEILYEDKDLIIVNKPNQLLTVSTLKEKEKTLYFVISDYLKRKSKNAKIFIVHRLDKDTSGCIVFAKNNKVQQKLQTQWNQNIYREYIAVVHKKIKKTGILKDYLVETKDGNVYIGNEKNGKLALTEYSIIKSTEKRSILKIVIKTGRKNQIRLQLANINHPIVGDRKYGIKDNSKNMLLHAKKIEFIHPISKKKVSVEAYLPKYFDI